MRNGPGPPTNLIFYSKYVFPRFRFHVSAQRSNEEKSEKNCSMTALSSWWLPLPRLLLHTRIQFIHVLILRGDSILLLRNEKTVTKASRSMNLNYFCIKLGINFWFKKYKNSSSRRLCSSNSKYWHFRVRFGATVDETRSLTTRFLFEFTIRKRKKKSEVKFNSGGIIIISSHV